MYFENRRFSCSPIFIKFAHLLWIRSGQVIQSALTNSCFRPFVLWKCKEYLLKMCILILNNTVSIKRVICLGHWSLLGPLLLIPSWCRVRHHQRCCCRGGGSHWMDVSILRGLRSFRSLAGSSIADDVAHDTQKGSIARDQGGFHSSFAFAFACIW